QLLEALGRLRRAGAEFNLLLMSRWRKGEDRLRESIRAAGIEERTWLLPFLHNGRVPGFIRACSAVCYLEHGWPMPGHTSIVPREIIACGTCLVVSAEVRQSRAYRDHLRDMETCIVVEDPARVDHLAIRLRFVLEDPGAVASIGQAAGRHSRNMPGHS